MWSVAVQSTVSSTTPSDSMWTNGLIHRMCFRWWCQWVKSQLRASTQLQTFTSISRNLLPKEIVGVNKGSEDLEFDLEVFFLLQDIKSLSWNQIVASFRCLLLYSVLFFFSTFSCKWTFPRNNGVMGTMFGEAQPSPVLHFGWLQLLQFRLDFASSSCVRLNIASPTQVCSGLSIDTIGIKEKSTLFFLCLTL